MHATYHRVWNMFALCNEPLHKAIPPVPPPSILQHSSWMIELNQPNRQKYLHMNFCTRTDLALFI
ncbi:hypothetical protein C8Q75DRAFT_744243 [Abortiporus biennis]|nr:hypothetical protein C8Q75DRAFT_744243 [Abortiporus biennis]